MKWLLLILGIIVVGVIAALALIGVGIAKCIQCQDEREDDG